MYVHVQLDRIRGYASDALHVQGRLGDLGRIDDKYDVAISTAAASGLESLVVDTRETAEAIFDHLRKHNIGRASCIALDRFGKVDLSPVRTPPNTHRLFDLVTPKEQIYAPAFRHTLKDTLVAPLWDVAQPVATGKVDGQRWRVVTLDGNIAEKSGAAQVGGSRPIRGKMSSKLQADDVSPQQLAKLEAEEKTAVVKLDEVAEICKAAESELRALHKELARVEEAIPRVEMDLEANEQDGKQKADLLSELRLVLLFLPGGLGARSLTTLAAPQLTEQADRRRRQARRSAREDDR